MKSSKLSILCAAVGLMMATSGYAVIVNANTTASDVAKQQAPATSKGIQKNVRYHIQNFPLHGAPEVKLSFVYEKNQLKYIVIKNVGGESKNADIVVNLLGKNHVLGLNDAATIDAPNVSKIVLQVSPYDPEQPPSVDALNLGKSYIFSKNEGGLFLLHTKAMGL